ncbi:hypothetical protein B0H13DRAFT_1913104 [Mycena leptocephala]|nr:hypothetical protein B0H13DRAFT_1913104 [Mycena leptocephala]
MTPSSGEHEHWLLAMGRNRVRLEVETTLAASKSFQPGNTTTLLQPRRNSSSTSSYGSTTPVALLAFTYKSMTIEHARLTVKVVLFTAFRSLRCAKQRVIFMVAGLIPLESIYTAYFAVFLFSEPKTSSARPQRRRLRLLPQVALKAGDPAGPAQTFDVHAPMLRPTSIRRPHRRPSYQAPRRPGAPQDPSGRVMDSWWFGRHLSRRSRRRSCTAPPGRRKFSEVEIIDAVDLQLHENPGVLPISVEDDWKALLHAAVKHSLKNSPSPSHVNPHLWYLPWCPLIERSNNGLSPSSRHSRRRAPAIGSINLPADTPTRTSSVEVPPSVGRDALDATHADLSTPSPRSRRPVVGGLLTETGSRFPSLPPPPPFTNVDSFFCGFVPHNLNEARKESRVLTVVIARTSRSGPGTATPRARTTRDEVDKERRRWSGEFGVLAGGGGGWGDCVGAEDGKEEKGGRLHEDSVRSHAPRFSSASAGYASLTQLKRLHRVPALHLISRRHSLPSRLAFPAPTMTMRRSSRRLWVA